MTQEQQLQQQINEARSNKQPLSIRGGRTKHFYGREEVGEPLQMSLYSGVVNYDPTELVLTAKAGTPIKEIQSLLESNHQMLGFEPPLFGDNATLGGVIATGLAGPSRPFRGSVRDFVLGIKLLTGQGEVMKFGGQVMKNVAGFDVSRLMSGALGVLGIILEASIKILPVPDREITVKIPQPDVNQGIYQMNAFSAKPYPISAASWFQDEIRIRLSGSDTAIRHVADQVGGELDPKGDEYWQALNEHRLSFFQTEQILVRASVAQNTPAFPDQSSLDNQLIDWAGGVRWIRGNSSDNEFVNSARQHGGHVTFFRNADRSQDVFEPLSSGLMKFHYRLKDAFDPDRILNPGRLYRDL